MKKTDKTFCPKCKSENIGTQKAGQLGGAMTDIIIKVHIITTNLKTGESTHTDNHITHPVFMCSDCKNLFSVLSRELLQTEVK